KCTLADAYMSSHVFFALQPTPPTSALFPSTTLFRSRGRTAWRRAPCTLRRAGSSVENRSRVLRPTQLAAGPPLPKARASSVSQRSEEHTSELQSHLNLVCRLLLEKKKNSKYTYHTIH